jgi:hypothetical protein
MQEGPGSNLCPDTLLVESFCPSPHKKMPKEYLKYATPACFHIRSRGLFTIMQLFGGMGTAV